MYTYANYHTSLTTILTGQTISAITWDPKLGAPTFTLQNNDTVCIYVYVSTSDYDLMISVRHNDKREGANILYDDKFASKEIEKQTGTVVTDGSGLNTCVGTTIQEVALAGSGHEMILRIGLSNDQQIQYSTSFKSTECSVELIGA